MEERYTAFAIHQFSRVMSVDLQSQNTGSGHFFLYTRRGSHHRLQISYVYEFMDGLYAGFSF